MAIGKRGDEGLDLKNEGLDLKKKKNRNCEAFCLQK
jgi:hypothetical protein